MSADRREADRAWRALESQSNLIFCPKSCQGGRATHASTKTFPYTVQLTCPSCQESWFVCMKCRNQRSGFTETEIKKHISKFHYTCDNKSIRHTGKSNKELGEKKKTEDVGTPMKYSKPASIGADRREDMRARYAPNSQRNLFFCPQSCQSIPRISLATFPHMIKLKCTSCEEIWFICTQCQNQRSGYSKPSALTHINVLHKSKNKKVDKLIAPINKTSETLGEKRKSSFLEWRSAKAKAPKKRSMHKSITPNKKSNGTLGKKITSRRLEIRTARKRTIAKGLDKPRLRAQLTSQNFSLEDTGVWQVAGSDVEQLQFGKKQVTKMRLSTKRESADQCFMSYYFQKRILEVEIPLNATEAQSPVEICVEHDGSHYELISVKDKDDFENNTMFGCKKYILQCLYVKVSVQGHPHCSLEEELDGLLDFASESSQKVVARMELLQSPVCTFIAKGGKQTGIFPLKPSDFKVLYEDDPSAEGNDGCGFISKAFKNFLFGNNVAARKMMGLQIRSIVPNLGLFKGMLLCKEIPPNEAPVQLTPSMRKVGPTRKPNNDNRALLMVTKAGKRPSKYCEMVHRLLDPELKRPPASWKPKPIDGAKDNKKKKKDMIPRLWQSVGVPKEVCDEYAKNSRERDNLAHCYVTGYTDPTDAIPPGYVFVTGTSHLEQDKFFVTRSPCILPGDGRILNHLNSKPPEMSGHHWEELNNMPFGGIIFSKAPKGCKPLPSFLANGDLDGDMYFICWDHVILGYIKTEPINHNEAVEEIASPADRCTGANSSSNTTKWLKRAQRHMADMETCFDIDELRCKLWHLSKNAADANKELFMNDPDAIAFAKAFNAALDYKKHGKKVYLPDHLHDQLPPKFHRYLH